MTEVVRQPRFRLGMLGPGRIRDLVVGLFFRLLYWPPAPARMRRYVRAGPMRLVRRAIVLAVITGFCFVYGFFYSLLTPNLLVYFLAPPVLLGLVLVWALPDSRTAPTRTLEWLFYAYFISMIVWPNYLAIALPGMPWITLVRLTGFPMLFFLLTCVSISARFRADIGQALKASPASWILLSLFVLIQTVSIGLSSNKADSMQKWLTFQVGWTAIFFVSAYVFRRPGRVELWAFLLWGMAVFLGLIALWEYKLHHSPWAGHIPGFLKIEDPQVEGFMNGTSRAYTDIYRVQATFTTSLALSEYMAFTMPFLLHFLSSRYKTWIRLGAAATIPFILLIVYLTNSRLGMVGCFMSVLLYTFASAVRLWLRKKDSLLAPAVVLAYPIIFAFAIASTFAIGHLRKALWGTGAQQFSTDARREQLLLAIPKILKNPLGYGVGQGGETLGYAPFGFLTIDSYYLLLLLEYGVIGFAVYIAFVGVGIVHGTKMLTSRGSLEGDQAFLPVVGIALLNFLIIKTVFAQQDNHSIIFMMMGMVIAIASQTQPGAVGGVDPQDRPQDPHLAKSSTPAPLDPQRTARAVR